MDGLQFIKFDFVTGGPAMKICLSGGTLAFFSLHFFAFVALSLFSL